MAITKVCRCLVFSSVFEEFIRDGRIRESVIVWQRHRGLHRYAKIKDGIDESQAVKSLSLLPLTVPITAYLTFLVQDVIPWYEQFV